jgi:HSP90 family molecular chaperone
MTVESYQFQAEIKQLLNILVHSLYTDREIFLRELISNASDALNRAQFEALTNPNMLDASAELYIEVKADEAAGTLTVSDSGIGMTRDDLVNNLGVIARSGAKAFVEALKANQSNSGAAQNVIGQFGVGFYSVFMVADRVRVVSRSHHIDDRAYAWSSDGGESFTIEPAERDSRGTDVILHLKEDAKEFLQTYRLKEIVKRHSDYIAFPIYVGGEETPTNRQLAIWRQDPKELTDEQYDEFYRLYTLDFEKPLHHLHLRIDSPIQFYALLYIPASLERGVLSLRKQPGLKLYARKVLIQEYNTDLLPDYLQFIQGVVDSEDLPLSVSRESVQATRLMATLKKTITGRVLNELKRLAKSKPDAYKPIYKTYARFLKQGLTISPADRADIEPLLYFASTRSQSPDDWVSLSEYVDRRALNQEDIYYVIADDFTSAARSPHLEAFRQRDIEVLYLTDPVDPIMLMGLPEFDGHALRSVDEAKIDLSGIGRQPQDQPAAEQLPEAAFESVRARFAAVLGERVAGVRESKTLMTSPARLVSDESGAARQMYRLNRLLDREVELPVKTLELNPRHPLIHNLNRLIESDADSELTNAVIEQIFETALLQEGLHPDPASMADRLVLLMQAATRS